MAALPALALLWALAALVAGCPHQGVQGPDAGPGRDVGSAPDSLPTCQGNNDGVITQAEMPMVTGITVDYLVNPPGTLVPVQPAGQIRGDGTVEWDFSDPGGQVFSIALGAVQGRWFESDFPGGHYAAPLAPGDDTLGV